MTIKELIPLIEAKELTKEADLNKEVLCGYTCDLLSWVMGHGQEGMAWVTVQTHMNVIAVASLMEMAAVIIPEGTNSTFDNEYMDAGTTYRYYNEMMWPKRFAECVSVDEAISMMK